MNKSEICKVTGDANSCEDCKDELRSALAVSDTVVSSVFVKFGEYASAKSVLCRMLYAESYQRHKMEIYSRWLNLFASTTYKSKLSRYGADGLGALNRCKDMLLKITDKYPDYDPKEVTDSFYTPLRNCFNHDRQQAYASLWYLEILNEAYSEVMGVALGERQSYVEACVKERLEAILIREKGLLEQADLKVQAADFALVKRIADRESQAVAQGFVKVVTTDIVNLAGEVSRFGNKQLIQVCESPMWSWFVNTLKWYVKARFPLAYKAADEGLKKESLIYRWFGVV